MRRRARHLFLAAAVAGSALLSGTTLSFYEESLPSTLNPLFARSMVDSRVHEMIFDRLYFHSPITNELTSRLVDSWAVAEGGKAVRLTLKKGVKWHDGAPFGADDVCFTIDAYLNPDTPSPYGEQQRAIFRGCKSESKNVALVQFTKIFHNPLERLAIYVLPVHSFNGNTAVQPDHEFSAHPQGTGPAKGDRGRRGVTFNSAPNLHHKLTIPSMSLQEGGDPLVQIRTLQNDGVQGMIAVPPGYRADVAASDNLALKSYDLRSWWFVAVNQNKAYLKDKRSRQALDMLLNRTELREFTIGVKANEQNSPCEFISGPFVQSSPFYNRSVPVRPVSDQDTAETLLLEAGFEQKGGRWHQDGEPVTLKIGIKASLNLEAPDLLSYIGNQLEAAGFGRQEFKIAVDDWNRLVLTGNAQDYDLIVGKWSFGLVEDVNPLFHTRNEEGGGATNIFGFSNPEVDALLKDFEKARLDTQAQDAYHKLHEKLAEELPYLFLWKLDTKSAWGSHVRGNTISPFYYWTELDSWKYKPKP